MRLTPVDTLMDDHKRVLRCDVVSTSVQQDHGARGQSTTEKHNKDNNMQYNRIRLPYDGTHPAIFALLARGKYVDLKDFACDTIVLLRRPHILHHTQAFSLRRLWKSG